MGYEPREISQGQAFGRIPVAEHAGVVGEKGDKNLLGDVGNFLLDSVVTITLGTNHDCSGDAGLDNRSQVLHQFAHGGAIAIECLLESFVIPFHGLSGFPLLTHSRFLRRRMHGFLTHGP